MTNDDNNSNRTRDGIEVKPGQVWRDCDQRMYSGNRHGKVVRVAAGRAELQLCRDNGAVISERITKIAVRRMYRHSTGWTLVKDVA